MKEKCDRNVPDVDISQCVTEHGLTHNVPWRCGYRSSPLKDSGHQKRQCHGRPISRDNNAFEWTTCAGAGPPMLLQLLHFKITHGLTNCFQAHSTRAIHLYTCRIRKGSRLGQEIYGVPLCLGQRCGTAEVFLPLALFIEQFRRLLDTSLSQITCLYLFTGQLRGTQRST